MVFLIVASTGPEDITGYANRVGNTWKVGRHGVGDGLLLVVVVLIAPGGVMGLLGSGWRRLTTRR